MARRSQVPEEVLEKFILGFEGHFLTDELRVYLSSGLAGVILFPRNFSTVEGLHTLTAEIRAAAGRPVLIGIDQEGGTRFSLPEPFTQWPSAEELGQLNDEELVQLQARALARELRAVGFNLDFAPMLDLHLQPQSPVTRGRSFGSDLKKVARLGAAFVHGLALENILACAKHFPGHGDTATDPHQDLPTFSGTLGRLRSMELVPFAGAISADVPLIMTAHILLPEVDKDWPASLSETLLETILRKEMGFGGLILADDLGMGAVAKRWSAADAAVRTFQAGSDLALLCHDWNMAKSTFQAVASSLENREFDRGKWNASRERIARIRKIVSMASQDAPPLGVIGCTEHRELVETMRERIKRGIRGD
jgi:beta-N-acetylhexosaminidase